KRTLDRGCHALILEPAFPLPRVQVFLDSGLELVFVYPVRLKITFPCRQPNFRQGVCQAEGNELRNAAAVEMRWMLKTASIPALQRPPGGTSILRRLWGAGILPAFWET